jgi:hypothetical protein
VIVDLRDDSVAPLGLGFERGVDLFAQLLALAFAFFQEPRLFGEAVFQIPRPAGKILVFAGLLHQLLYKLGDATMEAYKSGPFSHHSLDRCIKFEPLGSASVFHRLQFVVGCVEALFDGTDVSLECNKLFACLSAIVERSFNSPVSLARSASFSDNARSAFSAATVSA